MSALVSWMVPDTDRSPAVRGKADTWHIWSVLLSYFLFLIFPFSCLGFVLISSSGFSNFSIKPDKVDQCWDCRKKDKDSKMWNDCPLSSHIHDPSRLIKVWLMLAVNLISQLQLWQMPTLYGCRELEQMWFMTPHRALNLQCSNGNCRNNKMILTWYCTFIDNNQGAIMITMMEWELHDTTKNWRQHETCQYIMKISALNIYLPID